MKKLLTLAVVGMFSVSAAAYACDGEKKQAKAEKAEKAPVAKKADKPGKTEDKPKS